MLNESDYKTLKSASENAIEFVAVEPDYARTNKELTSLIGAYGVEKREESAYRNYRIQRLFGLSLEDINDVDAPDYTVFVAYSPSESEYFKTFDEALAHMIEDVEESCHYDVTEKYEQDEDFMSSIKKGETIAPKYQVISDFIGGDDATLDEIKAVVAEIEIDGWILTTNDNHDGEIRVYAERDYDVDIDEIKPTRYDNWIQIVRGEYYLVVAIKR